MRPKLSEFYYRTKIRSAGVDLLDIPLILGRLRASD